MGVEADEFLRAATLWSRSVLQEESEKKSQLSRKRGIGCRRKDGSIREAELEHACWVQGDGKKNQGNA